MQIVTNSNFKSQCFFNLKELLDTNTSNITISPIYSEKRDIPQITLSLFFSQLSKDYDDNVTYLCNAKVSVFSGTYESVNSISQELINILDSGKSTLDNYKMQFQQISNIPEAIPITRGKGRMYRLDFTVQYVLQ